MNLRLRMRSLCFDGEGVSSLFLLIPVQTCKLSEYSSLTCHSKPDTFVFVASYFECYGIFRRKHYGNALKSSVYVHHLF